MNTLIIKDIIINIILVTFPILIYLVLVCYKEGIDNKKDNLLTIALLTSLYLSLKYLPSESNTKVLLFCNIPIVVAYIKKKPILGIILSIINILYFFLLPFSAVTTISNLFSPTCNSFSPALDTLQLSPSQTALITTFSLS